MTKRTWTVAEAKARFSEVLARAESEGAQTITRRGREAATDALIAATATVHDLTLVTRNARDFAGGVPATIDRGRPIERYLRTGRSPIQ